MDPAYGNDGAPSPADDDDDDDDGDVAGEDNEQTAIVTIKEYVDELEAQELEVDMILGGDDGKECTYPQGYLPRQAVFSCITCCPEGNAGVCIACSMACHEGHEVIEIWTRRHFRCDCGNSKFGIGICKLFGSKDVENWENVYNQNFKGVYCTCKRPYPDPDCEEDMGDMLQCCVCEDWFHEVHLGLTSPEQVPKDDKGEPLYEELICPACASSLDFLTHYNELFLPIICLSKIHNNEESTEANGTEMVETDDATQLPVLNTSSEPPSLDSHGNSTRAAKLDKKLDVEQSNFHESISVKVDQGQAGCKLKSKGNLMIPKRGEAMAMLGENITGDNKGFKFSAFIMKKDWRCELCQCKTCCAMYSSKGVSFLLDKNDTIAKYEENATQKRKERIDDLSFLGNLSHVGKIEFIRGFNEMASQLSSFFASHKSGEAITSDDIYEFFDKLKRKRARLTES